MALGPGPLNDRHVTEQRFERSSSMQTPRKAVSRVVHITVWSSTHSLCSEHLWHSWLADLGLGLMFLLLNCCTESTIQAWS